MAQKLGRNEKCHCGSGKKYKKCCLEKDLKKQREAKASKPTEEEMLFEPESLTWLDEGTYVWGETEPEYFEDSSGDMEATNQLDSAPDTTLFNVPEISEAQDDLITDFLDKFYLLEDPNERTNSLKTFLKEHPELTSYIAAKTGAFLELKDPFMKQGRYSEYIDGLIFLRENHLDGYIQVFGYLDRDIISYLCMVDKTEEIDNYLDLFRKYPVQDSDNLCHLLNFFMCRGMFDQAHQLAVDVYSPLYQDPELELAEILRILTMGCFAPYLNAAAQEERTDQTIGQFLQCLKPYREHLPEKWFKTGFLKFLSNQILSYQNTRWTIESCHTRDEVLGRYHEMLNSFMGFIGMEKNMHWGVADHFRLLLSDFFSSLIPQGKVPKKNFPLTRQTIIKTLNKISRFSFEGIASRLLGTISALDALADYLVMTGSIEDDLGQDIHDWCRQVYDQFFDLEYIPDLEALALKKYPLF